MIDKALVNKIKSLYGSNIDAEILERPGGGCINRVYILELTNKERIFVKEAPNNRYDFFEQEAKGLDLLRCQGGVRLPEVISYFNEDDKQYLLLEAILPKKRVKNFSAILGRQLAQIHKTKTSDTYGLDFDNYIGSTVQLNREVSSWGEFFALNRIWFQTKLAYYKKMISSKEMKEIEKLIEKIPSLLPEPDQISLLHGDLWSGNLMADENGEPVIIDPAVYYGHREADLAMTELFARFEDDFYQAYNEVLEIDKTYNDRKDLYNLYHLLNHLNIFGTSYKGAVMQIVKKYVS